MTRFSNSKTWFLHICMWFVILPAEVRTMALSLVGLTRRWCLNPSDKVPSATHSGIDFNGGLWLVRQHAKQPSHKEVKSALRWNHLKLVSWLKMVCSLQCTIQKDLICRAGMGEAEEGFNCWLGIHRCTPTHPCSLMGCQREKPMNRL